MDKYNRLIGPLGIALKKRLGEDQGFDHLTGNIDSLIDDAPCPIKTEEVEAAFRITLRALLCDYAIEVYEDIESAMKICESPIEGIILATAILLGVRKGFTVQIKTPRRLVRLTPKEFFPRLTITPQAVIGDYRSDFLMAYEDNIPDFESEKITKNGTKIPGSKDVKSEILVECDGHDFHEKTKEQARRDKQRDRTLQSLGFYVFRFAGSEIYKDPITCAEEVFSQLEQVSEGF